jgi:hypothetical protein
MCMYLCLVHSQGGKVVRPYKDGPGAMRATLVAEGIESICAHTQPNVPSIIPETVFHVQREPLASVRRVCQDRALLRIISGLLPFRMPLHELHFLRVYEIPLQTGGDRKVPYHFSRNFPVPSLVS